MNLAHVHLLLNHIPVIGTLVGLLLLIVGMVMKSEELRKVSLGMFAILALLTLPVYFTGEPAGEVVEHLPGVTEEIIEEHEEAALTALIATLILGVISLGGLIYFRHLASLPGWLIKVSLILSIISMGLMGWTANLGGQIRHTEIRAGFKPPTSDEKVVEEIQKESESEKESKSEKEK
ncbi:hypothetical protein KEJ17_04285 [Candidatus Bathyarchaeota archaeon]|nr:hypothetical protein [Candidatus Bathyarchaeota archaeon]